MGQQAGYEFIEDFEILEGQADYAMAELQKLAMSPATREKVLRSTCRRLVPYVRKELDLSYIGSGLAIAGSFKAKDGDYPGALYEAAVLTSIITADNAGIQCRFAPGFNRHVYARGGIFQYGGVIGLGKTNRASSPRARLKLEIKSQAGYKSKNLGGGIWTVHARRFFAIQPLGIARLSKEFARLFQEEYSKSHG